MGVGSTDFRGCRFLSVCRGFLDRDQHGSGGDKVEVLDKLPIPLTIHLGAGSDKFIGNGERDTCYPEGAKRNRCYGGAGDDICITGQRNTTASATGAMTTAGTAQVAMAAGAIAFTTCSRERERPKIPARASPATTSA